MPETASDLAPEVAVAAAAVPDRPVAPAPTVAAAVGEVDAAEAMGRPVYSAELGVARQFELAGVRAVYGTVVMGPRDSAGCV
jgi:hypothetical protein